MRMFLFTLRMVLNMSRDEDLKRRNELEDKLKEISYKSSMLSKRLSAISKEFNGVDDKVNTLIKKKSNIPPQERSNRLEIYKYLAIVLLALAFFDILLLCSDSFAEYQLIFTIAFILLICVGLWLGYSYWSHSKMLKQDIELEKEITQIKSGVDELFKNRVNVQNDIEDIAYQMTEIIIELKKLTDVK